MLETVVFRLFVAGGDAFKPFIHNIPKWSDTL